MFYFKTSVDHRNPNNHLLQVIPSAIAKKVLIMDQEKKRRLIEYQWPFDTFVKTSIILKKIYDYVISIQLFEDTLSVRRFDQCGLSVHASASGEIFGPILPEN